MICKTFTNLIFHIIGSTLPCLKSCLHCYLNCFRCHISYLSTRQVLQTPCSKQLINIYINNHIYNKITRTIIKVSIYVNLCKACFLRIRKAFETFYEYFPYRIIFIHDWWIINLKGKIFRSNNDEDYINAVKDWFNYSIDADSRV